MANPNWDIVYVALKTGEFGMSNDSRIREAAGEIFERLSVLPEDAMDVANQAATILAASGEVDDLSLLISHLSEETLAGVSEGFTQPRQLLGYLIVDNLAMCLEPDAAVSALQSVISMIDARGEPSSTFDTIILNMARVHIKELTVQ